jgi:hypothetical protein
MVTATSLPVGWPNRQPDEHSICNRSGAAMIDARILPKILARLIGIVGADIAADETFRDCSDVR